MPKILNCIVFLMGYTEDLPDYGDLMTVDEFKDNCKCGGFIDYDGFGHPVLQNKMMDDVEIKPSRLDLIPTYATHIIWFNR